MIPYNISIFCLPHLDPLSILLHSVLYPRRLVLMGYNYNKESIVLCSWLCLAKGRLWQETGERRIKWGYLFLRNLPIINENQLCHLTNSS